jgi:transposase
METDDFTPHDWKEWRRMQALHLKQQGWKQRDIATALDVTEGAVSQWLTVARCQGAAALLSRPAPGAPPHLTVAQRDRIPDFLWHGAAAYGFPGDVWTCARVARVIAEEFGVTYSKSQVSRVLLTLDWSPQLPIRRAIQRDEEAITRWRVVAWPAVRAQAHQERRTLVFVDEAGFYLLPGVVKTYSPRGQTPILVEWLTHDHLSVMGGVTPEGKIYVLVREEALTGLQTIEFLEHVLRHAGRRLLLIWDGSPIHRRREVQEFLGSAAGREIRVEQLPGYAPDLNPWDAGGWHHLKQVEMRNQVCLDLEELHLELHLAIGRLRQKPQLMQAFFEAAGLSLEKL